MKGDLALESVNPATGETIQVYEEIDEDKLNALLVNVDADFKKWKNTSFHERSEKMRRAADILKNNADAYSRLIAEEMGKPISQGKAEAQKCAWVCEYYAEKAEPFLQDENIATEARTSYIHYAPMGVIFAVMPWNFPFWQVFRFAAPAIMAGNAVVLKHSENVTGCSLAVENVFKNAGFPENLFRSLLVTREKARHVIEHPLIKGVTLTGSIAAGRAVAAQAGSALKKTVMELGGSDPYLVLADAELDDAVDQCVRSRLLNSGQTCISAKRFIVLENIYDPFVDKFVERMQAQSMDDPFLDPDIGPQAKVELRDKLHEQVLKSIEQGAKLLIGGEMPDRKGNFYPPTVLVNVASGMPVFDEETFGPVAAIIKAKDEFEAVSIANQTNYGLGAAVFTRDLEKGEAMAREQIQAGNAFVNDFVKSDPRLPFGGISNSGYGRELSTFGIKEFTNIKTIYVAAAK